MYLSESGQNVEGYMMQNRICINLASVGCYRNVSVLNSLEVTDQKVMEDTTKAEKVPHVVSHSDLKTTL